MPGRLWTGFDRLWATWYNHARSVLTQSGDLSGSGLPGEPDCVIRVDCCTLITDFLHRLSTGEPVDQLVSDLYYGVMVEAERFLTMLFTRLQPLSEDTMSQSLGLSNSPEPATIRPS